MIRPLPPAFFFARHSVTCHPSFSRGLVSFISQKIKQNKRHGRPFFTRCSGFTFFPGKTAAQALQFQGTITKDFLEIQGDTGILPLTAQKLCVSNA